MENLYSSDYDFVFDIDENFQIEDFQENFEENDFYQENFEEENDFQQQNLDLAPKEKQINLFVSIDTEFKEDYIISLQVTVQFCVGTQQVEYFFIVFNQDFVGFIESTFLEENRFYKEKPVEFFYSSFNSTENVLIEKLFLLLDKKNFFQNYLEFSFVVFLYIYFSWKDLRIAFGTENLRLIMAGKNKDTSFFFQRKNIFGTFQMEHFYKHIVKDSEGVFIEKNYFYKIKIIVKDLFGWSSFGLKDFILSSGLSEEFLFEKTSMDIYKEDMVQGLLQKPHDFFFYAMNDSYVLLKIVDSKVFYSNKLLQDIYSIQNTKFFFKKETIPFSLGSLVNRYFKAYIEEKIFKNNSIYKLSFLKHGILNEFSKKTAEQKELFEKICQFQSLSQFSSFSLESPNEFERMKKNFIQKMRRSWASFCNNILKIST